MDGWTRADTRTDGHRHADGRTHGHGQMDKHRHVGTGGHTDRHPGTDGQTDTGRWRTHGQMDTDTRTRGGVGVSWSGLSPWEVPGGARCPQSCPSSSQFPPVPVLPLPPVLSWFSLVLVPSGPPGWSPRSCPCTPGSATPGLLSVPLGASSPQYPLVLSWCPVVLVPLVPSHAARWAPQIHTCQGSAASNSVACLGTEPRRLFFPFYFLTLQPQINKLIQNHLTSAQPVIYFS